MPGARSRIKPLSAGGSSSSSLDEVSQLEQHLQRQLEEDIARIFDESICSDLEVVCGKLKILTHSCILKARTHKFYHKLEAILHVNIGRNTFDEIYSFISDAYTECDIQHQENEIIRYLNEKLNLKSVAIDGGGDRRYQLEDLDESDPYATPNCISPEEGSLQKTLSSSPSTELTKEYYALVPIEGQILDKELIEQDELSNAFSSFIKLQTEQLNDNQITQCIKPTTLSLNSSHISKINKHSTICDISKDLDSNSYLFENDKNKINIVTSQVRKHISEINRSTELALEKCYKSERIAAGAPEPGYTPDSLIADEPSSSFDDLSAAQSASPAGSHAGAVPPDRFANMNNTFTTVSDSGFDNNGMLESLNSHKDVTLTDVSLSESTFHDLLNEEAVAGHDSDALEKKQLLKQTLIVNSQPSLTSAYKTIAEMSGRSSKDEKQRQNEEIVILESSSLSSETGSWESVFPPKMPEKDICEKFINIERKNSIEPAFKSRATEVTIANMTFQCTDTAQKTSNKSSCCFIDAASLADEEEQQLEHVEPLTVKTDKIVRSSSRPMPCEPKQDLSPIDSSVTNDNEDSLEQSDQDSMQKDISPTIFEMSLVAEDVVEANRHEDLKVTEQQNSTIFAKSVASNDANNVAKPSTLKNVLMSFTPNNSIISLKASDFKRFHSEGSYSDTAFLTRGSTAVEKLNQSHTSPRPHTIRQDILFEDFNKKLIKNSPIISDEASIVDHLPQSGFSHTGSPMPKRKIENIPIVSGAYIPPEEIKPVKTPKSASCAPAWIVDMSKMATRNRNNKRPGDKTCDTLKASSKSGSNSEGCKSRSSVESDSSEKSTHKFYIDLSTLPDAMAPEQNSASEASSEKKNIFSMFIDLGENSSTIKEMPARLSSSLNTKKTSKVEPKHTTSKIVKANKKSPATNNITDETFEKLESLCNSSQMTISEILQDPIAKKIVNEQREVESVELKEYHQIFPREGMAPTIKEEPATDQFCDIFVRLSDLDRAPLQKNDAAAESAPKTECYERMTRSIPGNNWGESSHTSSRSVNITSSFHSDNALSLNRLFPHLKNDISQSMPGSLSGQTRSPLRLGVSSSSGDRDKLASDISEMSSVQSSMCPSVIESSTTDDTSHISTLLMNCQSRLGQDLLRMFMEEIAPDVIVEVSGQRINAHKCILSSRCKYFAGILSGGWVESAGNVISLPPFSFNVVHFTLCHIYSGISLIPESMSIVELATIADMLSLEGLKEAIMFTLKVKYCHHFHEPCQVCTVGVLECFPLSSVYGLDALYRRCLRWITLHFRKVWPTKAFATLPTELLDKCYQQHLINFTADNLIDTVHDCQLTVASLQRCRWADVVARLCRRLVTAAAQFAAVRLSNVVRVACAQHGAGMPASAVRALDECLASAVEWASPEELCRTLALLHEEPCDRSQSDLIAESEQGSGVFAEWRAALRRCCEGALVRAAPHALDTSAFKELPAEMRRRLRDLMHRYVDSAPNLNAPPPPRRPRPRPRRAATRPPDIERVRAEFVPYVQRPPLPARQLSEPSAPQPPRSTAAGPPRVRTTKAQEERAKFNMSKSSASAAKPPEKPTKGRAPYGNAKPRYLEPRAPCKEAGAARRPLGKLLSSSESSRNSSPVLARALPPAASRPRTADPSTDSLSDSLNANKYATYTKTRRFQEKPPSTQPSKCLSTSTQSSKAKATKIPVYLNPSVSSGMRASGPQARVRAAAERASSNCIPPVPRCRGSLMMATKSSSAKMVHKSKESAQTQPRSGKSDAHSDSSRAQPAAAAAGKQAKQRPRSPSIDIPLMERSGTFLKDEPTFGDKTTNMDINE